MAAPRKILVVRVGRAGDMVMITPALAMLLETQPQVEIHLLTSREGARILRGYDPRLTRYWLYTRKFPRTMLLRYSLARELRSEGFDQVFVFEDKPFYATWLADIAPQVYELPAARDDMHFSERCLEAAAEGTRQTLQRRWASLPVRNEGRLRAKALLSEHGIHPEKCLVGMHPTFSGSGLPVFRNRAEKKHRHWPADSFTKLARLLTAQAQSLGLPMQIVIDALPEECSLIEPIIQDSGGLVTLLAAAPDFERYKAVLQELDVLITPNTGPMHIAAAVGTPVVGLFSGWSAEDCGPFVAPERFAALNATAGAGSQPGLAAITPEQVSEAVFRLLAPCRPA